MTMTINDVFTKMIPVLTKDQLKTLKLKLKLADETTLELMINSIVESPTGEIFVHSLKSVSSPVKTYSIMESKLNGVKLLDNDSNIVEITELESVSYSVKLKVLESLNDFAKGQADV